MKTLFVIIFSIVFSWSFTQDTIIRDGNIIIYDNDKIIQKEFTNTTNYIKIVYKYDEFGVLVRRFWYNKDGKLLSVSIDN